MDSDHNSNYIKDESFREHLSTIGADGKRKWITPTQPKGSFYNKKVIVSYIYYLLFFGLPFIYVNDRPLFLLNIPEGKFILFSYIFWPQDFFIFGLIMLAGLVFIGLFTMAFGRFFCGWICPQTVFMDLLFRRIDTLILGSAATQNQLRKSKDKQLKFRKYALKNIIYFIVSFLIANTFLSYIIGVKELYKIITEPIGLHLVGLMSILIFTAIFFLVFSYVREQVCTNICPYGRLQGVLLDKNSIVVAYDYNRGEPRAKFKKNSISNTKGDCIDCNQCVQVCPTGIDIRNGTQLECTNCTACIDACNFMMIKIGKPKGLIRYDTMQNIESRQPFVFNKKLKLTGTILSIICITIASLLITRKDIDGTILRSAGMLYQQKGQDSISNLYSVKLINKTNRSIPLEFKLENIEGDIQLIGNHNFKILPEAQAQTNFFILLPKSIIKHRKQKLNVAVYEKDRKILTIPTNFFGPIN